MGAYITDVDANVAKMFGWAPEQMVGTRSTGILQLRHDGSAVYSNARLRAMLHTETLATTSDLLAAVATADRPAVKTAVGAALQSSVDGKLEVEIRAPRQRSPLRCAVTIVAVADQEGLPGALICVNDVTESARLRDELTLRASHDPLTGCLNRSAVLEALEQLLSEPRAGPMAVIFIDVDEFKSVNDRLGHASGDSLLFYLARRLQRLCRQRDLVGRLGGDEFLLVCSGVEGPAWTTAIANRARDALNHPVALPNGKVDVRTSIGVAWPGPDAKAETLVAQADIAMYESKRRGNGEPVFYADIAETAQVHGSAPVKSSRLV